MTNFKYKNLIIIIISSLLVFGILWNTYTFIKNFKQEERNKMQLWSLATKELINDNLEVSNLTLEVLKKNETTPMIKVNIDGSIEINNIKDLNISDTSSVNHLIRKFSSENEPIKIILDDEQISTLYYGNSKLLNKLKFYPTALLIIASIFVFFAFLFFKNSKIAEINKLWSGMAKETAHQIGTPLSSLMGWLELLKGNNNKKKYIMEIEKDLERLNTISDRFNKIGSNPNLKKSDLVYEVNKTVKYLKDRISKKITLELKAEKKQVFVNLNSQLFSWCLENIIKNSVDSIKDDGKIVVEIKKADETVNIYVTDNGSGIKKSLQNKIFKPGVTTKDRGWGLGLSLAKRIIKEYHNGHIKIDESKVGIGTRILISMKVVI